VPLIFFVRPATRNLGNDVIGSATMQLLRSAFGPDLSVVSIPALKTNGLGGLTAKQVYDINRLADGLVIGGGNLLENGQIDIEPGALDALAVPLMMMGISYGRIRGRWGALIPRSDSLGDEATRRLAGKAGVVLVRDAPTLEHLRSLGIQHAALAGCPTLFLDATPPSSPQTDRILMSIRHPARMNIPPAMQWRIASDVRQIVDGLRDRLGTPVTLVSHDYADLEFAAGFPDVPHVYHDDVNRFLDELRRCRLSVTYRLHAFLPCLVFGTPSIHISYDERGSGMLATVGMSQWDVDMTSDPDPAGTVLRRCQEVARFEQLRSVSRIACDTLRQVARDGVHRFANLVAAHKSHEQSPAPAPLIERP
jgi:polysaccharide pyruvyl transferase WcaK-like protein